MKADIHPKYVKATVTCACGNSFETRSTVGDIRVEICSACHPFFTGKQKIVDREGRVEEFPCQVWHEGQVRAVESAILTRSGGSGLKRI